MDLNEVLTIHVQPIFNAATMLVEFSEVLMRPKKAKLSIERIVKMFEKCNKCIELDKFILTKACEFIRDNPESKVGLSINLCKTTLEAKVIYLDLIEIIKKYNVDCKKVILELNENTNFSNTNVIENIHELAASGIKIAIDDFGTGNTSLEFIGKTNAKIVKFDKIYLDLDNDTLIIMSELLKRLNDVGIETVIEGVETLDQLQAVKNLGYNKVQGFFLSRPISTESFKLLYCK